MVARPDVPFLFCLNATAKLIWQVYSETASPEAAVNALVETYGIPADVAAEDVNCTLSEWMQAGLLGVSQNAPQRQAASARGEASVIAYCSIEDTTFLLLTDSPEVTAEVLPQLDAIRIAACTPDVTIAVWSDADGYFVIEAGGESSIWAQGVGEARAVLFQELVRRAKPERQWLALLHAAACGMDGRCVLFPAASYSGKSTLAAALTANGFALYSDDFVGIEADTLRIPAMPFGIAVRRGSWDVLRPWIPEIDHHKVVERLGEPVKFLPTAPACEAVPGHAAAMVFSEWVANSAVSVRRLSTAEAIACLHVSGFWVAQNRTSIGAFLTWLERMPKFALQYGDLMSAVEQVQAIIPNRNLQRFRR